MTNCTHVLFSLTFVMNYLKMLLRKSEAHQELVDKVELIENVISEKREE